MHVQVYAVTLWKIHYIVMEKIRQDNKSESKAKDTKGRSFKTYSVLIKNIDLNTSNVSRSGNVNIYYT